MATVTDVKITRVAGSDREVFVTWKFNKEYVKKKNTKGKDTSTKIYSVKEYQVWWYYYDGLRWLPDGEDTVNGQAAIAKRVTHSVRNNAIALQVKIKPVSVTYKKEKKVNGKVSLVETSYYTGTWSTINEKKNLGYMYIGIVVAPDAGSINKASISISQLTTGSRTLLATWTWNKKNTASYDVEWYYNTTPGGTWLSGNSASVELKNATYDLPDIAYSVYVRVKPIAEQSIWEADWASSGIYYANALAPTTPSAPSVSVDKLTLTASLTYSDQTATSVLFELYQSNSNTKVSSASAQILTGAASVNFTLSPGKTYKVRAQAINGSTRSLWSDYSSEVAAAPAIPTNVVAKAITSDSVELSWTGDSYADSYTIEWTNKEAYFDVAPSNVHNETGFTLTKAIITTGENGDTYYFRIKAVKSGSESSESGWSKIASVITGKPPTAPTTWSLVTVANVGDDVPLYWVHNSQDNSSQVAAEIELTVNGDTSTEIINNDRPEDEKDNISEYIFKTSDLSEGAVINWRVRTKGVYPDYSEWSILRTLKVYAPPTLNFIFSDERRWFWDPFNFDTDSIYTAKAVSEEFPDIITSLPIDITAKAGPETQNPLRYTVSLIALDGYEVENDDGTIRWVSENEVVFERIVPPQTFGDFHNYLLYSISAGDVTLENNIRYRLECTVAMDSGLSASCCAEFQIGWDDDIPIPDAEIAVDDDAYVAYIMPYCLDDEGNYLDDILLSVYRRNYDGTFTEIAKDILGYKRTTVTDPHPALDYLRYRIIAKSIATGQIGYYDPPSIEYGETAIIIQWDEDWSSFDNAEDTGEPSNTAWSGSLLRLPYNIDTSENASPDLELVEYIGRAHPVSYFGTQQGETATWNIDIDAKDTDAIYALRRLKRYLGNCYVREPSGVGYWATVGVSFTKKHREVSIPVTLNITRVEGGA